MAVVEANSAECACCKQKFSDTPDLERHALACGHVYHHECINEYREHVGESFEALRCPICRVSGRQLLPAAAALEVVHVEVTPPQEDDSLDAQFDRLVPATQPYTPDTVAESTVPAQPAPATPPQFPNTVAGNAVPAQPAPAPPPQFPDTVADDTLQEPQFKDMEAAVAAWHADDDSVLCNACMTPCKIERCRAMSKAKGSFRCDRCHAAHTNIYKHFGAGLGKTVQRIPPEERASLFQFAQTASGAEVKDKLESLRSKQQAWEQRYQLGGLFKPRSV